MNFTWKHSIIVLALGCKMFTGGATSDPDQTAGAVVTFLHGKVTIRSQNKDIKPSIGYLVRTGDTIITEIGAIDLQTYRGDVIRVKESSSIVFKELPGEKQSASTLEVAFGNLIVKSNKLKSNQSFQINSPTMVAGVRGTAFTFELEKGGVPKVKVFEGAVAVGYRRPADVISSNELVSKETLNRFINTLENYEVILEPGEASAMDPKINEMIFLINSKIAENKLTETEIASFKVSESDLQKTEFTVSPRENAELETLVLIDKDLVSNQLSQPQSMNLPTTEFSEKVDSLHEAERKLAFVRISKEAESKQLDDESEIQNHYSILETIHKSNGEVLSGAVVAQLGDTFIVHSTKGVFELDVNDIEYIEYKNFKVKTKAKAK